MSADGMVEVCCPDCGQSLGWQSDAVDIDYQWWPHSRCPVRLAESFGISRVTFDRVLTLTSEAIAECLPEMPTDAVRKLRGEIAAGYAMEVLARFGYAIRPRRGVSRERR